MASTPNNAPPVVFDLGQLSRVARFLGFPRARKQPQLLRIGVLGASQVATYALLWPSRRLPGVEVVAVAARDAARAASYARTHGVPLSYGSYEQLLEDPSVDAVYVGLPNGLHGQWAAAALAAGKHVLCEKPFAACAPEAARVAGAARARGLVCREALHYREHPLMARLMQVVAPAVQGAQQQTQQPQRQQRQQQQRRQQQQQQQNQQRQLKQQQQHQLRQQQFSGGATRSSGAPAPVALCPGCLGDVTRIDVRLLIPRWVFGSGDIRFDEALAGGAMMDAGAYTVHVTRALAAAAGASRPPAVTSAAARLAEGSDTVDAAMVVNWSTHPKKEPDGPRGGGSAGGSGRGQGAGGWLRGLLPPWGGSGEGHGGKGTVIHGRMTASLRHSGPLPVSEVHVVGTRGELSVSGFVVPFFGNVVSATLRQPPDGHRDGDGSGGRDAREGDAHAAKRAVRVTERVYGSGESTYFYQLSRFAEDVRAVSGQSRGAVSSTAVKQAASRRCEAAAMPMQPMWLRDEAADCVANAQFIDDAYVAAGLPTRMPTKLS